MLACATRLPRYGWSFIAAIALTLISTTVAATPCDPDKAKWIPSRYYPADSVVFYKGQWYRSRQVQEGKTPGVAFEWQALKQPPQCQAGRSDMALEPAPAHNGTPSASGNGRETTARGGRPASPCQPARPWNFAESYTVGSLARHEGQTWRAIRPSNGDMPGVTQPPHWQPVDNHCPQP